MQIVSFWDNLHGMVQPIFLGKKIVKYFKICRLSIFNSACYVLKASRRLRKYSQKAGYLLECFAVIFSYCLRKNRKIFHNVLIFLPSMLSVKG